MISLYETQNPNPLKKYRVTTNRGTYNVEIPSISGIVYWSGNRDLGWKNLTETVAALAPQKIKDRGFSPKCVMKVSSIKS